MLHSALLKSHLRLKVKARLSQCSYKSYINAPPPLLLVQYLRAINQKINKSDNVKMVYSAISNTQFGRHFGFFFKNEGKSVGICKV